MNDAVILLLCAVALAQGFDQNLGRSNNVYQICQDNYDNYDVLVAHAYCDKFYKCAHGKPVVYDCPDNLLYDPITERCQWPFSVDCGDRPLSPDQGEGSTTPGGTNPGDSTPGPGPGGNNCDPSEAPAICAADNSDGVLVAHENCNQYYVCSGGKPVALSCPPNLLFNPIKDQCDWPQNVECGDRVIPNPDDSGPSPGGTTPGGTNPGDSTPAPGPGGNNCDPSEAPAICATDNSDGVLVAHENCNQYYVCSGGKPVALSCPPNLLFNPVIDQCDWPQNVECGDRVIPDPETGSSPGDGGAVTPSTRPPGTCNCNPGEAPSICAAEGSSGILVAHENCNQFYKCDHGKPVVLTCNGNLLYNPYTEQCDWPENVDCGDRVIPDPDESVPSPTPGGTTPGETNPGNTTPAPGPGGNNCDPSEAPAICAADNSDGVLVAHENCNQFYVCSGGKPVALSCPPNLLFNPVIDQCDWPQNVECGDRVIPDPETGSSPGDGGAVTPSTRPPGTCNCNPEEAPSICAAEGSSGILVAHENCNQFYKCDHGKPVVFTCNGNLLYNPYTEQCDWPENVDCGDRVIPDPDESVPSPGNTTPGGTTPGGTNPGNTTPAPGPGGNNCDPSEAPAICAADNSDGVLVAHENCNQFYVCSGGKPVALSCPPNLLFNPVIDQCDWPQNVECGDRVIPDPETGSSPGDGGAVTPSTRPPGTCNCNPEEAPSICAAEGSSGILVAHENCNQFYKCDHGKPVVFTCNGNLLYNPYTEQCDWPENVDCGDRVIPDPDESVPSPGNTTPGGTTPGGTNPGNTTPAPGPGGNNCDPSEAPAICAADNSDGVLVAHENCNQFYVCSGGKPVALSCPPNLLFNPVIDQCDWPQNVECGDRVIPDPETGSSPGDGGAVTPSTRPPGTCNCNPEEAPSICAAEGSSGILVAHENCNQFYKCDHGKPVVFTCNGNLLYNPYTEQCDWPENVDCGDRVIPDPDESVPSPGNTTPGGTTPGGTNPGNTTPAPGPGGNNCDPSEAPAICAADNSDGVLVAHENCNQFYVCSGGKPVALSCPPNLLFNPVIDQCDWPQNVECGDRVIPDPETGSSPGDGGAVTPSTRPPGTCNCNPEEAPSICAAEGSGGILVAHENCNQFYKCDHGKPVVFTCNGNLLYNPYTEQCDWPENVDCGDRVIPDPDESVPSPGNTTPGGTTPGGTNPGNTTPAPGPGGNNCDPSEAPAICAADNSDGVLVAHENCNQFYVCSGGKPVALSCPPNLLFNPVIDQCDWPQNVECGDRIIPDPETGSSPGDGGAVTQLPTRPPGTCNCNPEEAPSICAAEGSSGILVAHENCNQFYTCDHGKPVVFTCNGNLLYNPYTEQCDWPENVDCGDRVIPDPDDSVPSPGGTTPDGTNPGDITSGPGPGGNNCDPSEAPAICAAENSDGVLVAHENCNQYYVCSGGKPVALSCPPNLLFNPVIDQCDWPQNVECGDRIIPDPETGSSPGDGGPVTQPPTRPPGTCNCNPEEAPSICAAEGSSGILVAHENCNQFYKCDHGKPAVLTCNGNLLYNPYTEQCDWPENVDCGDRVIPDPDDSVPSPGGTTPGGTNPGDITSGPGPGGNNCDPSEAPAICAADNSDGVLVAHENCNQYYVCSGGKPVALSCPPNLLFNPVVDQCDWPQNVECGDRIIPDPETGSSPGDGGAVTQLPTRPPGTCNCNPEEAPSICAAEGSSGILVAHENCNQFYTCDHGKPVVFTCNGNLLYNPYTEQCDWPENVDCGERVIPDPDDSVPSPGGTTPGGTNPGDVTPAPGPGGNNCDPSEAPAICAADNSEGVLVAHENCDQFYICLGGQPVALRCPSSLLFNPNTDQCDWPQNVECGVRIIPDPEIGTSPGEGGAVTPPTRPPGTCNCNPEEAPSICAAEGASGILVAHENCNQFYKCDHGKPVVLTCNGNLLYNPYTEQCDWPENVECGDRVIPEIDDNTSGSDDSEDINNSNVNDDPSKAPLICAGHGTEGVLVAHEYCDQYYICAGGVPVSRPCNGGLLFNPFNQHCDWPSNVKCSDRIVPDDCTNPRNAQALCAQPGSNGKLVAHENCNQFYLCANLVPVAHFCPAGLLYNIDSEFCDWPSNVNCGDRIESKDNALSSSDSSALCAQPGFNGRLVAHENCNQFYLCSNSVPWERSCPPGLLFNAEIEVCDWPGNVDCGDRIPSFAFHNKHWQSRQPLRN